jgi:hypothetical protein
MSNYTKNTNFTAKDNLTSGDPAKVIKGAEFDTEFNAIQTAVNSKADSNNSQLTGTTDAQAVSTTGDVTVGGNLSVTGNATIAGNLTFGNADTDTVSFSADVDSNILPNTDAAYDLGSSSKEWRDLYVDGTAYLDTVNLNGTNITATASELNTLDGITATTSELNKLDGFTGTVDDLNYAKDLRATGVTTAEFDKLDGLTATTSELNTLDGITATTTELNTLDGITATTSELNKLDGVTSNIQTQLDNKADDTTSPTLTLDGDVSGSATLTNLGDATLTVTVADDSHNHTIANVDGLQTALDGKATTAQGALADSAVQPNDNVSLGTVQADGLTVDGNVGIGTASPNESLHVYDASANVLANFESGDANAFISFKDSSTTNTDTVFLGATGNNMVFYVGSAATERARIDSSGNLLVGRTNTWDFSSAITGGAGIDNSGYGYFSRITGSGTPLYLQRPDSPGVLVEFYKGTANVGKIGVSSGGDFYLTSAKSGGRGIYLNNNGLLPSTNIGAPIDSAVDIGQSSHKWKDLYLSGGVITSSDYRLKEDIQPMQSYADTVKQMNLVNFAWKESGEREDGFIAHELQALVPSAVRGDKDAVNEDGEAQYQGVDPLKLIPVLTKALQEAIERIETLENN